MFLYACLARLLLNLRGTRRVLSPRFSFLKTFTRFAIFNLFGSLRKGAFNWYYSNALIFANRSGVQSVLFSEESEAGSKVYDTARVSLSGCWVQPAVEPEATGRTRSQHWIMVKPDQKRLDGGSRHQSCVLLTGSSDCGGKYICNAADTSSEESCCYGAPRLLDGQQERTER